MKAAVVHSTGIRLEWLGVDAAISAATPEDLRRVFEFVNRADAKLCESEPQQMDESLASKSVLLNLSKLPK